jgi:hypothetical protein
VRIDVRAATFAALSEYLSEAEYETEVDPLRETLMAELQQLMEPQNETPETLRSVMMLLAERTARLQTMLTAMLQVFPVEVFEASFLSMVREISFPGNRADVYEVAAPLLPDDLVLAAVNNLPEMTDDRSRMRALIALAPHLPAGSASSAVHVLAETEDAWERLRGTVALIPVADAEARAL